MQRDNAHNKVAKRLRLWDSIRVAATPLGTIWLNCFDARGFGLQPFWRHTIKFEGKPIPWYWIKLRRDKETWTIDRFIEVPTPSGCGVWPRGLREKVQTVALEIGGQWAASNENVIRERGIARLKRDLELTKELPLDPTRIQSCADAAIALGRPDLLQPIQREIDQVAMDYLQRGRELRKVSRRISQVSLA